METNTTIVSEVPVKKGIPGSTLKIIAISVMFIDHFAAIILESMITGGRLSKTTGSFMAVYCIYCAMRLIGRLGFPIFCFLLVEGFSHTHNKLKYLRNLAIFALISEIPFDLGFKGNWYDTSYQNVFFTLLIGLITLIAIDFIINTDKIPSVVYFIGFLGFVLGGFVAVSFIAGSDLVGGFIEGFVSASGGTSNISSYVVLGPNLCKIGVLVGLAMLILYVITHLKDNPKEIGTVGLCLAVLFVTYFAAEYLHTDYSGGGVLTITVMYLFKKKSNMKAGIAGCVVLTIMQIIEGTAFFILIPLKKYNGQRGISLKYFFYAFYPVHILLLYLVNVLLGFASLPWVH